MRRYARAVHWHVINRVRVHYAIIERGNHITAVGTRHRCLHAARKVLLFRQLDRAVHALVLLQLRSIALVAQLTEAGCTVRCLIHVAGCVPSVLTTVLGARR